MKADPYDIKTVFGFERQLFAPLFQRPYVWNEKDQWEPLWQDVKKLAEELVKGNQDGRPHFLGAVVLDQMRVPVGKPDARSIIDGQQRLTTLQLLMGAVRDLCHGHEDLVLPCRKLERLIYNDDVSHAEDRYKLWPTNVDRPVYMAIMDTTSPLALRDRMKEACPDKRTQLAEAYEYFHKVIGEWINLEEGELAVTRCTALVNAIRDKLRLVVIDMDQHDDAQTIFETLNARGTPLLPSDLVKNYLFQQAQEAGVDVERLHRQYWERFDVDDAFWRAGVRVGSFTRPRIDVYLQHYLAMHKRDDVALGQLFQEYRDFAERNRTCGIEWLLQDFHRHAQHFRHFLSLDESTREGTFFSRLQTMELMTAFPFLLTLYDVNKDASQRQIILDDLESYLVRRMVCRLTTQSYNRTFLDLMTAASVGSTIEPDAVRHHLLNQTADSNRWPDDDEFLSSWLEVPLYRVITRPRLRLILRALDSGMHDGMTESYTLKHYLTVEHFMPQTWEPNWPLSLKEGETPEEYSLRKQRRSHLIQTIGNLTMLTSGLNPVVSNGPFAQKRERILKHSAINLNRFLHGIQEWDEDGIRSRAQALFKVACEIWRFPASVGEQADEDAVAAGVTGHN